MTRSLRVKASHGRAFTVSNKVARNITFLRSAHCISLFERAKFMLWDWQDVITWTVPADAAESLLPVLPCCS